MASTFKVDIVSAEKEIFSGEGTMVTASAQMGEVGIAPGHAPFITGIKPGEVHVKTVGDAEGVDIYVSGGILEVQPNHVTILADAALRGDEIDEAAALKAKEEAEAMLTGSPSEVNYAEVQARLAEASAQLSLIKKLRQN